MRKYSQESIISPIFNKKNGIISKNGGTTGESLLIYIDIKTKNKAIFRFERELKEYDFD